MCIIYNLCTNIYFLTSPAYFPSHGPLRHALTSASASLHRRNPADTLPASRLLRAASATAAAHPMLPARSCCLSFSTTAVAVASRHRWKAATSTSLERWAARRATCRSAACRVKSCVRGCTAHAGFRVQGAGCRVQGACREPAREGRQIRKHENTLCGF